MVVTKRPLEPLDEIIHAIQVFGHGRTDVELPLNAPEKVGALARAVHKMMRQVRRRADARVRLSLEVSNDALIGVDSSGTIVLINQLAEDLFGRSREELIDHPVDILIPDELRDVHGEHMRRFFQCPRPRPMRFGSELQAVRKDGTKIPVEIGLNAFETDDGVLALAAIRDVSARKEADATIKRIEAQLLQSQRLEAVGALAGGIAHEFNNLLQAIQGYTNYAMDGLAPGDQRLQDLQQVEKAAGRAATLTRQLLGFGRRQTMQLKSVEVNDVVSDTQKMLKPVIGEHIDVRLNLQSCVSSIVGDPAMLQQVLLNLCVNARDAMPQGGHLLIKTEQVYLDEHYCNAHAAMKTGAYVLVSVSDTGAGMTKEVLEKIFEPFFTTKEVGKGTGLGLAMVYGIVQQHGGSIYVYSEPGIGTTFRMYLPVAEVEEPSETHAARAPAPGGSETILLAEDEPMVRGVLVRVLENAGYRVLQAGDGEEAKRVFDAHAEEISLALLDAVMPKCSGHEVCRHLKSSKPDVRVLYCTGYDPDMRQHVVGGDADQQFIQKPVDPSDLLHAVRELLEVCATEPMQPA